MKAWLIDSGLGSGFCFRLLAPFLLSVVAACDSGRGLVDDCSFGACLPEDTGTPTSDATINADGGAAPTVEAGDDAAVPNSQRSPLCALSGCFPGFAQACGAIPVVDDGGAETSSSQQTEGGGEEGEDDVAAPLADGGVAVLDGGSVAIEASASADAALVGIIDVSIDRVAPAEASVDDSQSVPQACYVIPTASGVKAACAPAGRGAVGSACHDSSDCASTFACVEIDGSGVCRSFSCALPPNCLPGTFYQQAPLMAAGVPLPDTTVPVCSPNVPCPLLEKPTPCAGGKVCAVVGQGETSCMTPGPSKQNEWCDEGTGCGEGLVCALRPDKTQNRCLKLCHIDMGTAECPGGTCQGGNNAIPDGFGICVGDIADGG